MRRRRIYRLRQPWLALRKLGVLSVRITSTGRPVMKVLRRKVTPKDAGDLLSIEETSKLLGIARATMYEILQDGLLTFDQEGRVRRIAPKALREFILGNMQGGR